MAGESERRSSRQRKAVNYQKIFADASDDDDFADEPPSKRSKRAKGRPLSTVKPADEESKARKVPRLSREEKLYHRAIEQALKESQAINSPSASNNQPPPTTSKDEDFVPPSEDNCSESPSSDDSEFHCTPPTKPAAKKKQAKTTANRSKKLCNKTTSQKEPKQPAKAATNKQTTPTATTSPPVSPTLSATTALTESCSPKDSKPALTPHTTTPASALTPSHITPDIPSRRRPKWTPPSTVVGRETPVTAVRATGSPMIRLGLSRHAKVKPLHPDRA